MPSIDENRGWASYHWRDGGEEWSSCWGSSAHMWHVTILPRIFPYVVADHVLEIAPGHGRCTEHLRRYARRLSIVDLVPECIAACRARFADATNVEHHTNDGKTLPAIASGTVDFVFSWDSLVHAEDDVMASYALEIARTLRPGGFAFLHHSNLASAVDPSTRALRVARDHWRARSMSAEKMAHFAATAGLQCVTQELVPWGGELPIDCFSLLRKPRPGDPAAATRRSVLDTFAADTATARRLRALYPSPEEDPAALASPLHRDGSEMPSLPLRYRVADAVNAAVKRIPILHGGLKRAARVLARADGRPAIDSFGSRT
jgi:SAM-dependent methyltransferase